MTKAAVMTPKDILDEMQEKFADLAKDIALDAKATPLNYVVPQIKTKLQQFFDACGAARAMAQRDLIDYLRQDEGDSVEIICDNAVYGEPDRLVIVSGGWTNWAWERYGADTLLEALTNAANAREKRKDDDDG
jgi:hypothetical protein